MLACEYDAVRHVLTAPQIARRTAPYIGVDDFDFAGLEREAEIVGCRKVDHFIGRRRKCHGWLFRD